MITEHIPQAGPPSYQCEAKVPDEATRKVYASFFFLVNMTSKFTPYIRYQYCVALWKTNLTYPICVVTWPYYVKEGFLGDSEFSSVLYHHDHHHLYSRKFGPQFLTVTTLRVLFVLLKSSTNDS